MTRWQLGSLAVKIKLPDRAVVVGCQRCRFTPIHTATPADGNHAVVSALAIVVARPFNICTEWVGRDLRKHPAAHSRLGKGLLQFADEGQLRRTPVRDDERVDQSHLSRALPQLLQPTGPVKDRDRKRPLAGIS